MFLVAFQSSQTQLGSEKETEHRDEERGVAENSREQLSLDGSMEMDVTEEGLEDEGTTNEWTGSSILAVFVIHEQSNVACFLG